MGTTPSKKYTVFVDEDVGLPPPVSIADIILKNDLRKYGKGRKKKKMKKK